MRSGELFAGVGGLGMAVDEVFDASPAWFCEFDGAPSKVLAHHFPDVPNFGDVRAVDWSAVERVNVIAGGFPCQDVSLAGRRRGLQDGTRSGLWSEFAKAIDEIRPDWVVIENVRGLLSADAAVDLEPCPLCVGDNPGHVLRALGAVLGDLADLGFDAEWTGIRAADVGAPHGRFRVFILAWPRERTVANTSGGGSGRRATGQEPTGGDDAAVGSDQGGNGGWPDSGLRLLPTPEAKLASSGPDYARMNREGSGGDDLITTLWREGMHLLPTPMVGSTNPAAHGQISGDFRAAMDRVISEVTLLPTPVAQPSGNTPEDHLRKKPGREVVTDLAIIAENGLIETGGRLLPTTTAMDANASGGSVPANKTLTDAIVRTGEVALLPTPTASEGDKGGPNQAYGSGGSTLSGTIPHLTDWGPYASAIQRWEQIIGRPAPAPVRYDGKGGKPRLNPELTEWMMGWPLGWVTASVIGLSRAEQLKACGNGVVPQQAAAALRILLARPGVPAIEWGLAA